MRKRTEHKFIDDVELKWCGICRVWFDLDTFAKREVSWDRLSHKCKSCDSKYKKARVQITKKQAQKRYWADPEKARKKAQKWRLNNIKRSNEISRKAGKKWRVKDPEKLKEKNRISAKERRAASPEKFREVNKKANKKRYLIPRNRLHKNISCAVAHCLKNGKGGKTVFELLEFSSKQLIEYLTKTMPNGYTWDDYICGKLHIDHIVPQSVFNFEKPEDEDFQRCWALSNLRLIPAFDNMSKHNKLDKPFQPSLIFG